ncbi:hybrid sensor histidine kinase/response regulator [Tardiphaga alba]|uniref:histidine kinase n=1 Tax=Tardiphaga alba TaxID=340268 RepID=A0ABX8A5R5_9BRAD|nr:ATP-binding protein [Tardiphaga alba]QUS38044.1 hybrid sensor histidine kinase/response regulator [Tardiphaga alba]
MRRDVKVLVVEDDRIVARDISEQLERAGIGVLALVANAEEAVEVAKERRPDLVLMDVRLEGRMDGIEAAKLMRDHVNIPVVFLTAYADEETIKRATDVEPFGFLLKPFDDLQLRTVVEMALYKHGSDRKLRESERRYEATLSSIGDGVIAIDRVGRVTFINPVAENATGWQRSEAIGEPLENVYRPVGLSNREPSAQVALNALNARTTCQTFGQASIESREGRQFHIDETAAPIFGEDGDISGVVLVFSDRSEQRRAATALQAAQANLARMSRVTAMGQLTATIAHEVNQPLTALLTNAETCLNWLDRETPGLAEARAAAGRVTLDAHRAKDIIRRISAIVKNSPIAFEVLDLSSIIENIRALVLPDLSRDEITFTSELMPTGATVVGDTVQLQQVLLNLLNNAAESVRASRGSERVIKITSKTDDMGTMFVSVEDSGDGIAPESDDQIFEPFYTTKKEGTGIGLSICRSIIEAHGGRIWAEARSPSGARFTFTLPQCQL